MMYRKLNFMALNMTSIKLFDRLNRSTIFEERKKERNREKESFLTYSLISVEQSSRKLIANYALVL